jgi:ketosteroid isomerase-like protein
MKNVLISSITLCIILFSCSKGSHTADHTTIINKLYKDWVQITNSKDINSWSGFLSPDAVFLPPESGPLESIVEIKNYYIKLFQDPNFKLDCNQIFLEVAESEDLAWSRGFCKSTFSNADGDVEKGSSKWTKVWVRMSDGSWKCKLNTWNKDHSD